MFNYFKVCENKYKSRISSQKPIVIRLDGKNVCKNDDIVMIDESEGGFSFAIKETGKFLSKQYNCISYVGTDEINLIFLKCGKIRKKTKLDSQKISSLIAQETFLEFNKIYKKKYIFFDAKTFNIPTCKIFSYLKYREQSCKNVFIQYFAKGLIPFQERININLCQLEKNLNFICEDFKNRSEYLKKGAFFYEGQEIKYNLLEQKIIFEIENEIDDFF